MIINLTSLQCIPENDDEHTLSNRSSSTLHYYLLPCYFLFDRCHKLMNLVLKSLGSAIRDCSFSAMSDICTQSRKSRSSRVNAVASLLLLIHRDPKLRQIMSLFRTDIDNILQEVLSLQVGLCLMFNIVDCYFGTYYSLTLIICE